MLLRNPSRCPRAGCSVSHRKTDDSILLQQRPQRRVERDSSTQHRKLIPGPRSKSPEQVSPLSRKRRIGRGGDGDDDDGNQLRRKRPRLTRKNLARLNNMAKKKGTNKPLAGADSTADSSTTQSKTISTTSPGFADQADKNGILNPRNSRQPENFQDRTEQLARSRETASPPESMYRRYLKGTGRASCTEMTVLVEMTPLLKTYDDDDSYSREFNRAFSALPKGLRSNDGLSAPQPDFVEGLEKREFRPFPVGEQIAGAVLYKDDPDSLALPHLAGEWKGPGKDMQEAMLQSSYDGAALVHGRNQALSYIGKPDPAGTAEVVTFTTDGTNLNFFAHYASPSTEDGVGLEYHQYPITSTNLKNSFHEFKQGYKQLRNLQDHARDQSYALRDKAKEHWKKQGAPSHPTAIAEGAAAAATPPISSR